MTGDRDNSSSPESNTLRGLTGDSPIYVPRVVISFVPLREVGPSRPNDEPSPTDGRSRENNAPTEGDLTSAGERVIAADVDK